MVPILRELAEGRPHTCPLYTTRAMLEHSILYDWDFRRLCRGARRRRQPMKRAARWPWQSTSCVVATTATYPGARQTYSLQTAFRRHHVSIDESAEGLAVLSAGAFVGFTAHRRA